MRYLYHGALGLACALLLTACGKPPDRVEITDTTERSEHQPVPRVTATSEERFGRALPRTAPPTQAAFAEQTNSTPSRFEFQTPEGWMELAPTQFRNPNFLAGPTGEVECYVSLLAGGGGSLFANANRWRGQMGQEPFTEEEFAEQSRTLILGNEAVIVDFEGAFAGMGQTAPKEGYRLLGALVETLEGSVFVKMVGPSDAVEAQRDGFAFLVTSLRFKETPETAEAQQTEIPESGELPPDHPDIGDLAESPAPAWAMPASGGGFHWTVPEGWSAVDSPSSMRLVTFNFGPGNPGECYVVVLSGSGGGRLANMNRWLEQMGEPPLLESELPLQPMLELFDEEAPLLVARGTYSGMGGEPRPNHTLYGATGEINNQSVFIKFIAPDQVADAHASNFVRFCSGFELD